MTAKMIENLKLNTGKSLEQWITIVKAENFSKHGEIIKFLKQEHSFTHGFANLVALKARKSDADSFENKDDLVDLQYKGKEHFKPLYDKLIVKVSEFGNNIEIAPKKRSEEHTSELQSLVNLVCRLLLEKKKYIESSYI